MKAEHKKGHYEVKCGEKTEEVDREEEQVDGKEKEVDGEEKDEVDGEDLGS